MPSTDDATVSLMDLEDSSIDARLAPPIQTLFARSPLNTISGNTQSYSHSAITGNGSVSSMNETHHHQTSSLSVNHLGANADGTEFNSTEGGHNFSDLNYYQQKKNLAQGMMDIALLSANANQLRYILEVWKGHTLCYVNLVLISISIFIQIAVGFGLIWKTQYNMQDENGFQMAHRVSNYVSIGVFMITIVNVMLSAFSIAEFPIHMNVTVLANNS